MTTNAQPTMFAGISRPRPRIVETILLTFTNFASRWSDSLEIDVRNLGARLYRRLRRHRSSHASHRSRYVSSWQHGSRRTQGALTIYLPSCMTECTPLQRLGLGQEQDLGGSKSYVLTNGEANKLARLGNL